MYPPDEAVRPRSMDCPECGSAVNVDPRFVAWCASCEWNVDPTPDPTHHRYAQWRRDRTHRAVQRVFNGFLSRRTARVGWTFKVVAWTVAGFVHLLTLSFVALAVWMLLDAPVLIGFRVAAAVVLLGLACLARPRLGRMPKGGLTRETAPHLYRLVDQVADLVGARAPNRVYVDNKVNASFGRVGLRRRRVMILGLPMWEVLSPEGRVALLGHELGHDANGDWRNGVWMGSAINTLAEWHWVTRPPGGHDALANWIVPIVLAPLSVATWIAHWLLSRVTLRNGQCAEYRADLLGLRAGGTAGALALTEANFLASAYAFWIRRMARGGESDPMARLREYADSIPVTEHDRIRRAAALQFSRIDGTHPPNWLRYQLVVQTPPVEPAVTTTASELDAIAAELNHREARATPRTRRVRTPYTRVIRVSR